MHPLRSTRDLYSSKWFLLGMIIATASWGLHVAALALAPMSVIQVSLAAGVVFIAVMADRMFGFTVGPRQWVGLILTAIGLVLLGITLPAMHGAHAHFSPAVMIAFEAGLFGIGGLLIMGPRMGGPVEHHGVMLAAAAGLLFGVSDTSIKALTGITGAHGMMGLRDEPVAAGRDRRLHRRLLRLRPRPAGRRSGTRDRRHRHRREHRGHRRRASSCSATRWPRGPAEWSCRPSHSCS